MVPMPTQKPADCSLLQVYLVPNIVPAVETFSPLWLVVDSCSMLL